jgi:peptidoglycan/LPS O-acetylase OafA/YrhL
MLVGFLIWLAGCAVVGAYSWWRVQKKILLIPYLLMALLVLGGCLVAARFSIAGWLGGDPAVGVAFAVFLFAILHLEYGGNSPEYSRAAHLFAGFSYSLYVLHFPLLLFVKCWLVPGERWQPDAKHLFVGLVLGLGMMVFAWAVSLVTENRTSQLRGMLRRLTGVSGQPRREQRHSAFH